ncbi:MAG: LPS assembly lipoprotein LptE [Thiotrichales bacterium]|nr:LPS assembly lipoprotein LptE [Thiotrichales bacterium]MCY4351249.1 LPS assembly lipoprotein LptE [Thiotrichales bacterium]
MPMITARSKARNVVLALPIAIAIAMASGCGYQLRGAASLAPELGAMRVTGPGDIRTAVIRVLGGAGVPVEPAGGSGDDSAGDSAGTVLHLEDERLDRRVLSVDPDTVREREFELAYRVTFRVTDAQGEELVPKQTVSLLRDYVFDTRAVLAKDREQEVLHAELRRDAAARIVDRVAAMLRQ